jgi:hypothetical protein
MNWIYRSAAATRRKSLRQSAVRRPSGRKAAARGAGPPEVFVHGPILGLPDTGVSARSACPAAARSPGGRRPRHREASCRRAAAGRREAVGRRRVRKLRPAAGRHEPSSGARRPAPNPLRRGEQAKDQAPRSGERSAAGPLARCGTELRFSRKKRNSRRSATAGRTERGRFRKDAPANAEDERAVALDERDEGGLVAPPEEAREKLAIAVCGIGPRSGNRAQMLEHGAQRRCGHIRPVLRRGCGPYSITARGAESRCKFVWVFGRIRG